MSEDFNSSSLIASEIRSPYTVCTGHQSTLQRVALAPTGQGEQVAFNARWLSCSDQSSSRCVRSRIAWRRPSSATYTRSRR